MRLFYFLFFSPIPHREVGSEMRVKADMNLSETELKVLEWWKKEKIFERSVEKNAPGDGPPRQARGKDFVFYEGPPTANGKPGIHHVLSRAFKDIIPRYKTMQGYRVVRKGGWDTHGLPVEIEVEKQLGLKNKKEVEQYGMAAFNTHCRESVWKYKELWEQFTERMGFWLDLEHAYITYEGGYINGLWSVIKKFWERGLLREGHKVVPHCPRCGTALSSHELALGYAAVKDLSLIVKFPISNFQFLNVEKNAKVYILSWTTTPWTLPGNVALAVGENIEYIIVKLKTQNSKLKTKEYYILAKARSEILEHEYEVIRELKGSELVGLEYESLFEVPALKSPTSYKAYAADFVSTQDGTGVVHTAVMYGEDDYQLGTQVGLPKVHTVNEDGTFIEVKSQKSKVKIKESGDNFLEKLAGRFVKDPETERLIIEYLERKGLIFKKEFYEHDYPFCWRCKTPLLYYAKHSWFVAMSKLRNELFEANNQINWVPSYIKEGRFGEWLREVKDWAFSRERYWGTPLPIWICQIGNNQSPKDNNQINPNDQNSNSTVCQAHPDKRHHESFDKLRTGSAEGSLHSPRIRTGEAGFGRDDRGGCGRIEVIGSVAELVAKAKLNNRYIFMRHGEAESNVKIICNVSLEESKKYPLTTRGEEQAAKAAAILKKEGVDKIISSDFFRTQQTAEIIGKMLDTKVMLEPRIREYDVGRIYERAPVEKLEQELGDGQARLTVRAVDGGEALGEVLQRMAEAVKEYEARFQGNTILIVSHGDPLWVLLWAMAGSQGKLENFPYPQFAQPVTVDHGVFLTDECGELDLHRPRVDEVAFPCECGGVMRRVPEVADVWFDSGAMPFVQYHENIQALIQEPTPAFGHPSAGGDSPLERPVSPERMRGEGSPKDWGVSLKQFPADYIAEAIDQTRGWFYTLLAVSVALGKSAPYKNVICLGHVLDAKGKKMSKSLGNIIVPGEMFEKYGADAVRWYLYTINDPGLPKRFDEKELGETVKKFFMILWNVISFHELYPPSAVRPSTSSGNNILFPERSVSEVEGLHILDRWILARLNQLTKLVTERLDAYDITPAGRAIQEFVTDLSTWYVRRSRERMKAGNDKKAKKQKSKKANEGDDAENARVTLRYVLTELSKLIAPFVPFTADALWQRLSSTPPFVSSPLTQGGSTHHNPLPKKGEESRRPSGSSDGRVSVHLADWPQWQEVDSEVLDMMDAVRKIVEVGLAARAEARMPIRQPLASARIKNSELRIAAEYIELIKDELNVKEVEVEQGKGDMQVELDTVLTEELKREGMKRELIRGVNNLRKEAKLTIQDTIVWELQTTPVTVALLGAYKEELLVATLASDIRLSDVTGVSRKGKVRIGEKEIAFGF